MTTKDEKDLIGHDIETEARIFRRYAKIRNEKKDICNCSEKVKEIQNFNDGRPVSFFIVGADMKKTKYKIMFVGKVVTWGFGQNGTSPDPIDEKSGFIDIRFNAKPVFLAQDNPFFACIREVCKKLWETDDLEEIWRRIAVTNMVKCSISANFDKTTPEMKDNCLEAGFVRAEIEEVKPTHLIFFTGHKYDSQIRSLFDLKHEITDEPDKEIKIWWTMPAKDEYKMQVLRTYHPYYLRFIPEAKQFFYEKIVTWITTS